LRSTNSLNVNQRGGTIGGGGSKRINVNADKYNRLNAACIDVKKKLYDALAKTAFGLPVSA